VSLNALATGDGVGDAVYGAIHVAQEERIEQVRK
jgi:hypothetical protein